MALSIDSIDALLESDEINDFTTDVIREQLGSCIDTILDRKGQHSSVREASLDFYTRSLTCHYVADIIFNRVDELLAVFNRTVKQEPSELETSMALECIALTAITYESATLYESVSSSLKRAISDSKSLTIKGLAIRALGISASFGGAEEEEIMEIMTFLLEIVSSDGAFIEAHDSAAVVTAALNVYAFLATQVEDLEAESEDAVEAFLDQLDSSDAKVQVAAGENIALLYEKSYTPREEGDESSSEDQAEDHASGRGPHMQSYLIKRYDAYHNKHAVMEKVSTLASFSSKSVNRRDKKLLHQTFACVEATIEDPRSGLQSNNASKLVVRVHREGEMRVDKWWKLMRLNAIRRLLGAGFVNHYLEGNKQLLEAVPMLMRGVGDSGMQSPRKIPVNLNKASKGKYRESRRFVSAGHAE